MAQSKSNPGVGNLLVSNNSSKSIGIGSSLQPAYGGQAGTFITSGIQSPPGIDTVSIEGNLEVSGTGSINLEPSGGNFVNEARTVSIRGREYDVSTLGALEAIIAALRAAGGNKRRAARDLGIGIATLYRKIKKYAI